MARRLSAVPETPKDPPRERAPDLRDAVKAAIGDMDWLKPSDHAMATLALRQAEEIEKAVDRMEELEQLYRDVAGRDDADSIYKRLEKLKSMCEVTKTVGWLGPQLQGVLRDLGGSPAVRAKVATSKTVGSRLSQLRKSDED